MLNTLLMPIVRLILPLALGAVADMAVSFIQGGKICANTNTVFCTQVWPTLAGMIVTAITYLRTHPNGSNGDPTPVPDAVSKALQAVKLAPTDNPDLGGNG